MIFTIYKLKNNFNYIYIYIRICEIIIGISGTHERKTMYIYIYIFYMKIYTFGDIWVLKQKIIYFEKIITLLMGDCFDVENNILRMFIIIVLFWDLVKNNILKIFILFLNIEGVEMIFCRK